MRKFGRGRLTVLAALFAAATLWGCSSGGDDSSTVVNPNPNTLMPKGTIQGHLYDRVTQQPIVGAVVDIGLAKATTTATGQFVIRDVPATTETGDGKVSGNYQITIDLRNVTSPVKMKAADTTVKYPEFSYDDAQVVFTSFDDTKNDGGDNSSNHDTPIVGLVASKNLTVGKLSAGIAGIVAKASNYQPVDGSYTVTLKTIDDGHDDEATNDATGLPERVVAKTTTAADGTFAFSNIEALQDFRIEASTATMYGEKEVTTPADGEVLKLSIQNDLNVDGIHEAVLVSAIDSVHPKVITVSVENGSDLAPTLNQAVTFTFSEPIKATAYTNAVTADMLALGATGLYNDVTVTYDGPKNVAAKGNIEHSLSWNADMTQLTVTIAETGVASKYTVDISGAIANLKDSNSNEVEAGAGAVAAKQKTSFTTNGGEVAAAPDVVLNNAATIDYDTTPILDWEPASGAKSYNVYCAVTQVWGDVVNTHPYVMVNVDGDGNREPVLTSNYEDDSLCGTAASGGLVENKNIKRSFKYIVKGVSANNGEGAASNVVEVSDVVNPKFNEADAALTVYEQYDDVADTIELPAVEGDVNTYRIVVPYNEPMNETLVTDIGMYSITANEDSAEDVVPVVTGAVYNADTNEVTLLVTVTKPAATDLTTDGETRIYSGNWTLTIDNLVTDVAGNTLNPDFDSKNNGYIVGPVVNTTLRIANNVTYPYGNKLNWTAGGYYDDDADAATDTISNGRFGDNDLGTVRLSWDLAELPAGAASLRVIKWYKIHDGTDNIYYNDGGKLVLVPGGISNVGAAGGVEVGGLTTQDNRTSITLSGLDFVAWTDTEGAGGGAAGDIYVTGITADSGIANGATIYFALETLDADDKIIARSEAFSYADTQAPVLQAVDFANYDSTGAADSDGITTGLAADLAAGDPGTYSLGYALVTFSEPMAKLQAEDGTNYDILDASDGATDTDDIPYVDDWADYNQSTRVAELDIYVNITAQNNVVYDDWYLLVGSIQDVAAGSSISSSYNAWMGPDSTTTADAAPGSDRNGDVNPF